MTERATLLTRHGKADVIAPALAAIGWQVTVYDGFDTDSLGTFSRDIPRHGSQRDAALHKAQLACQLGGSRYGLGSEGSAGADPWLGSLPWGRELIVCWDAERGYAIEAWADGPAPWYRRWTLADAAALAPALQQAGHPATGVMLQLPGDAGWLKDADAATLQQALDAANLASPALLETDLRAHRNPGRMALIGRCAEALASRLASHCPQCHAPGWHAARPLAGAACADCGAPTTQPRAWQWACPCCGHHHEQPCTEPASPAQCNLCNP